ncbi:putative quinol monooxygenase [Saccharothrix variisporea]|uniref:Quinol monooxygenase YgiN n=1 Tax=Saccharothrix variisporea TaxID=543527 RepID=A0A495X3I9_9PSEU|nr:antibiotic biosynthesis monooxygenase [Saccharothrix variisporea]RKT67805.1 quinol monooxygenase YgiN [Saccharothrix variisporea]
MTVVVVTEYVAGPGQADRLRTALEALIEPALDNPCCLTFRPYLNPNDPAEMAVVEEWTDPAALTVHHTTVPWRHAEHVLAAVLARPATVRRWQDDHPPVAGRESTTLPP